DGFGNRRRPIDRAEIPIAPQSFEALPVDAVRGPARRTVKGKAGDASGCVLIRASGPAGFVTPGDGVAVNPLPVAALIGTAPEPEPDDFDRHVRIGAVDNHA